MAERSDLASEVADALEATPEPSRALRVAEDREKARRTQALSLRLAGFTFEQIAERLNVSETTAKKIVNRTLERAHNANVDAMRALENERLDRVQSVIWAEVLKGDQKAINTFLKVSSERSKLNGLYAPQKIDMSMTVKDEMQRALEALDEVLEIEAIPEPTFEAGPTVEDADVDF